MEHYKMGRIQPVEYIKANGMARDFFRGNVIKYITRYPYTIDGIRDLEKAYDYLGLLIELEKEERAKGQEGGNNAVPTTQTN